MLRLPRSRTVLTLALILLLSAPAAGWADPAGPAAQPIAAQLDYQSGQVAKLVLFSAPQYELVLLAFDQGQELEAHTVPFSAYIQVIEGEALLLLDGRPIQLKAGEGYSLPADLPHALQATAGRFKLLLLKPVISHSH